MPAFKIIGISGTNGSGKDTVGQMLAQRHGFLFVSVSDILRQELANQGLPPDRHHTHQLSTAWRRQHGLGVLIDKAVQIFNASEAKYKGLAIASLRNPGEADAVHKLGGKVIWVDADPKLRHERVGSRGSGRSVDDRKSFGEFLAEEQTQMEHIGDEATLSMSGVKAKADIFIENNGNDLDAFKDATEKALAPYLTKP